MSIKMEKSRTSEEVESLTIHGLSRVASAKSKYTRMIWLALCLSAAISFGMISVNSLIKYFQFHSFVDLTLKQSSNLALPAITFCHTNYYNPLSYYYSDPPVFQYFPESCNATDRKYFANEINMNIFQFACKMFIGTFESKTSAMKVEMPHYFRFPNGFELTPNKDPCITLNRNSTLVQYAIGEKYGLHMILFNYPLEENHFYSTKDPLTDRRNGIYVMLHDPKMIAPMGDGIVIPPGFHTHISVTKKVFKRLPYPYPSNCANGLSDLDSIYPGKNTLNMCYSSCVLKKLYKICPGVIPEMKVFMKAPVYPVEADVFNSSFWACVSQNIVNITYEDCRCSEHCDEEVYTTVTSRNPWPQDWQTLSFLELVNKVEGVKNRSLSKNEIRQRLAKITIYYPDFREHISKEQASYDLSGIASDLGGQMGLFLGASLLSLAEIIALVLTYIKRKLVESNRVTEVSLKSIN